MVLVLLVALAVSAAILLVVVALVWWVDRYDREPIHLVAMVFLWGASAAPLTAIFAYPIFVRVLHTIEAPGDLGLIGIGLVTPFLEEITKAAGVLLVVVFSNKFDNPTDGVVYGTASGLGFAVTENVVYGIGGGAGAETSLGILILVGGRTLLSAGVHAICSATFGGFIGYATLCGRRLSKAAWILGGLILATAIHGAWNMSLVRFGPVGEGGGPKPWLAALGVLYLAYPIALALFLSSEHRILKRELAIEVELETVPGWVLDVIPYYRKRVRGNWWPSRNERTVISRLLTRMAFRKHALRRLPPGDAAIASLEVVRLRQRLREIFDPEEPEAT
ncbi:MAG: PrsW family intramembrane metalloprotease [Acidobacteria bacterium]|nr:PrsW family intramembrane metalloprotease [Acidobacteriota bacterium]